MNNNIYNALITPVVILDNDRKINYCNSSFADLVSSSQNRIYKRSQLESWISFKSDINFNKLDINNEREFSTKKGKSGIVNTLLTTEDNKYYILFINNMTLEDSLHQKYQAQLQKKVEFISKLNLANIELEKYGNHLEELVEERTAELKEANSFINAMIDSVNQGLFVFNKSGDIDKLYTKPCDKFFELSKKRKNIIEIFKSDKYDNETLKLWSKNIFEKRSFFNEMVNLGPKEIVNKNGQYIELSYFPMSDEENLIGVVTLATDKTEELKQKREIEKEQYRTKMITTLFKNRYMLQRLESDIKTFFKLTADSINSNAFSAKAALSNIHTLKGIVSFYYAKDLEVACHHFEEILSQETPEKVMRELKILEDKFDIFFKECRAILGEDRGLTAVYLDQEELTSIKDVINNRKIEHCFAGVDDYVKFLAESFEKEIEPISWQGVDLKVDVLKYQGLFASLIHIFKNMVDHAIEDVETRKALLKPSNGQISVKFTKKNRSLIIEISDDGKGIEKDDIGKVFLFGDSSKESAGLISGRGVGMYAVKTEVELLKGSIEIKTKIGIGTTFIITVPL